MRTFFFRADLILDGALHLGSGNGNEFLDGLILRDGDGRPLVSGTAFCGLLASQARDRLRVEGAAADGIEREPVFRALFGSASGEAGAGRESRLIVLDAPAVNGAASSTFVQDRISINRDRGSAEHGHLFHDEVVSAGTKFAWACELREKEIYGDEEAALATAGCDPNRAALHLLVDSLYVLARGYGPLGGKSGSGHGLFHLERLRAFWMDDQDPDDVLTYTLALGEPEAFEAQRSIPIERLDAQVPRGGLHVTSMPVRPVAQPGPELVVLRGILRPLDPLLVKTGYSSEIATRSGSRKERSAPTPVLPGTPTAPDCCVAVDAAFTRDARGIAYLPGSSLRGCFRAHVESVVRTLIHSRFGDDDTARSAAWDLKELEQQARSLGRGPHASEFDFVYGHHCLVSRLFGSSALGGRIRVLDAVPVAPGRFEQRLKLLDHVAIDRWTGGAAMRRKFSSRPFVPYWPPGSWDLAGCLPDDAGDLKFEIQMVDPEMWHLGLVALLLGDLHGGRVRVGYGRNKGFGRVLLLPEHTELEALTSKAGHLASLVPDPAPRIGGFLHVPRRPLAPGTTYWLAGDDPLYPVIKEAVVTFRRGLREWTRPEPGDVRP